MLARRTEIHGHCGVAVPQRLSFSPAALQDECYPVPDGSLMCFGLVGDDAIVIEIPDHGKIQYALPGMDVRDVRYPFPVGPVRMKLSVQQIPVLIGLITHLQLFPAADFGK